MICVHLAGVWDNSPANSLPATRRLFSLAPRFSWRPVVQVHRRCGALDHDRAGFPGV